jgi:hypothetical protein
MQKDGPAFQASLQARREVTMTRRPIPVDLVIVAADQILDRLYEAVRNTCLDEDAVLRRSDRLARRHHRRSFSTLNP